MTYTEFTLYPLIVEALDKNIALVEKALNVRRNILKIIHSAQASHLGSSMSVVEMLISMYSVSDVKKILAGTKDRDRIIVSKGHAAAATYAVMHEFGLMGKEIHIIR